LTGNKFIVFHEEVFSPLVNLQELFLNDNRIKALMGDLFRNNTKLRIASFNDNRIFVIDSQIFDYNTELVFVGLADNYCLDQEFNIVDGDLSYLQSALTSCSEYRYFYLLIIPFTLLIVALIAYAYYLAVIKRMKLFHK
jgi:hypothetical protein